MSGAVRADLSQRISRIRMSGTMEVAAEAECLRRQGLDVVDLSAGEPDFPTPEHIKQAAHQAIADNFTRYTSTAGMPELREAICQRHAADFGTGYRVPQCLVTMGGKHAVFNFMQAVLDPGDEVLIPAPYWVTYRDAACYAGARPVFVPTDESAGFTLTAAHIEPWIGPHTRLLVLNTPNNPSGAVLEAEQSRQILDLALSRGFYILADECYGLLVYESRPFSLGSLPGAADRVLVAGSVSKAYAMTGWRIGFALGPEAVIQACIRLQSHSTSNPNSIAQKAALEALRGPQDCVARMLAEYRRRRDFVSARLARLPGVRIRPPAGAFYAYPNISALLGRDGLGSAEEFARRLLEQERVAVVPGEAFGTGEHIRLSFAASRVELERGLDRLERFVSRLQE